MYGILKIQKKGWSAEKTFSKYGSTVSGVKINQNQQGRANGSTTKGVDTKVLLSFLWIVVMIVLSRVLKYKVNRWVNIITSIIKIVFVVRGGASYPHIFIATVETICLLLIIWNAWKFIE